MIVGERWGGRSSNCYIGYVIALFSAWNSCPPKKTLECKNEFIKVVNVNSVNIYSVIKHTYIDDTCMCVHVCVPKLMM